MKIKNDKFPIIITTINKITKGIECFRKLKKWSVILVGDKKTPHSANFQYDNLKYLSISSQRDLNFDLVKVLPENHYCRKNLGYLFAISNGATIIGESDDDNIPYEYWFDLNEIDNNIKMLSVNNKKMVFNIYKLFTDDFVWPRGFPLDLLHESYDYTFQEFDFSRVSIIQGLADLNPDVDAIFRLLNRNKSIYFKKKDFAVALDNFVYCPFNSQNTIWKKEAFVYLYLPLFVTFRFTDILRSYIAQRGLWAMNKNVCFAHPTVYQERNVHDLMEDFKDEVPVYIHTNKIIDILNTCNLSGDPFEDIVHMYKKFNNNGIVVDDELKALNVWLEDLEGIL